MVLGRFDLFFLKKKPVRIPAVELSLLLNPQSQNFEQDMPNFEIEGRLHRKYDSENKSQSFQTREFVLEVPDGNYPQFLKFQLTQDRCPVLDSFNEGETLKVHFDLRGREWQGKFFTNLNAWRIERAQADATEPPPPQEEFFPNAADEPSHVNQDLPF